MVDRNTLLRLGSHKFSLENFAINSAHFVHTIYFRLHQSNYQHRSGPSVKFHTVSLTRSNTIFHQRARCNFNSNIFNVNKSTNTLFLVNKIRRDFYLLLWIKHSTIGDPS